MEWGMLGDEGLLSGREKPPASPRLNLWSRKWDTSGQSKSCQWEAGVSFFNSQRSEMLVMPWGKRRTSGIQRERRKWNRLRQHFSGTRGSAATELRLPGKLARGRGAQSWAYVMADVEDAWLDWGSLVGADSCSLFFLPSYRQSATPRISRRAEAVPCWMRLRVSVWRRIGVAEIWSESTECAQRYRRGPQGIGGTLCW